jgi:hypothetical protein
LLNKNGKKRPDNPSDHKLHATGESACDGGEKKAAPGYPGAAFGNEAV